jgi:ethanolamine ammonia-lyase small subunit
MQSDTPRGKAELIVTNGLSGLRRFTPARIALGRAGTGQPTAAELRFRMDHARARDAVQATLDVDALERSLRATGWTVIRVSSAASNRAEYLRRPDRGRALSPSSRPDFQGAGRGFDIVVVVADGLSALAVEVNLLPVVEKLRSVLEAQKRSIGPLVLVQQGRVAVGDEIGELLKAKLVVMLIGERPGLSSADSLGAYITWRPRIGTADSSRNCISNIRPAGLQPEDAAVQLANVIDAAFACSATGVRPNDPRSVTSNARGQ